MHNRTVIASWSFILGSVLFTLDALVEIVSAPSVVAVVHLAEGLLFLVGSLFLLPKKVASALPKEENTL